MRTRLLFIVALSLTAVRAADPSGKSDADPFDLSKNQKKIEELGLPTSSSMKVLEQKASELYRAGNWKEAAAANHEFAKAANWFANLISAGLRPFYNSDHDDRQAILRQKEFSKLAAWETDSNAWRRKRDRASVIEAECYVKLGDKRRAVTIILNALETLDGTDTEYWSKARGILYDAIEVK